MSAPNIKREIRDILRDLEEDNFNSFCDALADENNEPKIFKSEVEKKSQVQVVNLVWSRYTDARALEITIKTLREIGCNNEAKKLESRCKPAPANMPSVTVHPSPVQETSAMGDTGDGDSKTRKPDELYAVNSNPRGICLILNNIFFQDDKELTRHGSEKDAESLAKVFSWLGFTVVMCVDQTRAQMSRVLRCFSSLSDPSELLQLGLKEWSERFVDLQQIPKHGDAFICCILSHGDKGVVFGTDGKPLPIKDITRTFRASPSSPLTGKPKVFLIQACQGGNDQRGVIPNLRTDAHAVVSIPEDADVLVALSTVEDCVSFRDESRGSWFIQSLCPALEYGCLRGDDIHTILQRVHREVGEKEGHFVPGLVKQMPECRHTLRKTLKLQPLNN